MATLAKPALSPRPSMFFAYDPGDALETLEHAAKRLFAAGFSPAHTSSEPASSVCASAISGHFGRQREAFDRRGKNCVSVGGAAGRLVELREWQRRLQFEASRLLRLRDADR
jgi:hypothetical protein